MQRYDIIIIGGGVIGSAIGRELTRYQLSVAVLEKESDVCTQTSGRNTGMLHAGFLYQTGSLKAQCAVEGNAEFDTVARELDVPFKRTGKLIVGFTEEHRQRLLAMMEPVIILFMAVFVVIIVLSIFLWRRTVRSGGGRRSASSRLNGRRIY